MATLEAVETQAGVTHERVREAAEPRGLVTRRQVRKVYRGTLKERARESFMFQRAKSKRVQGRLQDQLGLDADTAKSLEQKGKHVRSLGEVKFKVVTGKRGRAKLVRQRSQIGSIAASISDRRRITRTVEAANQVALQNPQAAPTPIAQRSRPAAAGKAPVAKAGRGGRGLGAAA